MATKQDDTKEVKPTQPIAEPPKATQLPADPVKVKVQDKKAEKKEEDLTQPQVVGEPAESFEERTTDTTPWVDEDGKQVTGAEDVEESESSEDK